jgi:hypothetical protein
MSIQNEMITEPQAIAVLKTALANVSKDLGVMVTTRILCTAVDEFKSERRVAGAHGYGYRK